MIETNWKLATKCREDGQTLAGVVKNAQLSVYGPVINWFACQVAREASTNGTSQLVSWPMQTMNLIPDQILLTRLLTAERKKGDPWTRTCVVLRPFHALTNFARTYSRNAGPSASLLKAYNEAKEKCEELDQEEQHFWFSLFREENDPYVKMLETVYYGSFFLGAVPRLDNEKNLPRLEFLVPSPTREEDGSPWSSAKEANMMTTNDSSSQFEVVEAARLQLRGVPIPWYELSRAAEEVARANPSAKGTDLVRRIVAAALEQWSSGMGCC